MKEALVRVSAPHFTAGLVMGKIKGKVVCVRADPILGWAVYKSAAALKDYFARKGWTAKIVSVEDMRG